MSSAPGPERLSSLEQAAWDALQEGRIEFQRCRRCAYAWLPPRSECPNCLADAWVWEPASGRAELVSWVLYHHAFHPSLVERVPYAVALVELEEGPRMVTGIAGVPGAQVPRCGAALRVTVIEQADGVRLAQSHLLVAGETDSQTQADTSG